MKILLVSGETRKRNSPSNTLLLCLLELPVVLARTTNKCTKMRNARALGAKLFFFFIKYTNLKRFRSRRRCRCLRCLLGNSLNRLFCGVCVAVAVVPDVLQRTAKKCTNMCTCKACRAVVFAHLTDCFVALSLPLRSSLLKFSNN